MLHYALFPTAGPPVTDTDFASLPLSAPTLATLASLGVAEMTPLQAQSLPLILQGRDVGVVHRHPPIIRLGPRLKNSP